MTQAQKIAKDKFKKAIEYRKKTGVSLKEAFEHIYGKKVGAVKKKAAPKKKSAPKKKAAPKKKVASKKVTGSHKDTKSHNVNIRVVSGIDKVKNDTINKYKEVLKDIKYYEDAIKRIKDGLPGMISVEKVRAKNVLKRFTAIKNELKIHSKELKKLI